MQTLDPVISQYSVYIIRRFLSINIMQNQHRCFVEEQQSLYTQ